jgi:hypothetical protein
MCTFCLLSSFKKGGKIQKGLNCENDGFSEACLSWSHSSIPQFKGLGMRNLQYELNIYQKVRNKATMTMSSYFDFR